MPEIRQAFDATTGKVGFLIMAFTLPGIALTPILGVLSNRHGRKRILAPAQLLFGVAGGMCVFVRSFELLLALRFPQGMGASALGTLNVTVTRDIYGGRERSAALGYNSSVLSVGSAGYPAIGGLLTTFGWFYPFALAFLAVPIGFLVLISLHNPEPRNEQRLSEPLRVSGQRVGTSLQPSGLRAAHGVAVHLHHPLRPADNFSPDPDGRSLRRFFVAARSRALLRVSLITAVTSSQLGNLTGRFSKQTLLRAAFILYAAALTGIALAPSGVAQIIDFAQELQSLHKNYDELQVTRAG